MRSMNMDGVSATDGTTIESRREALKKFGRYAAAAPTVMMLLQPVESYGKTKSKPKDKGHY
jgi:hypothetical protein